MTRVLAIDEGTTGVSVSSYDARGRLLRRAYAEIRQHFPRPGWVEHDPVEIWRTTLRLLRDVAGDARDVAALGVTNQRETVVLWDRKTGRPVHRAIVWQDRRTSDECGRLRSRGLGRAVRRKTGLVLDPYFSATKLQWLLRNVRPRGDLCAGTVDTWLLWNLTGGRVHATDPTNASRTMLFDIDRRRWDGELLDLFRVPRAILPEVRGSASSFGTTARRLLGREVPITGVAGDQQAALFGQGCVRPGQGKNTYGTGAFFVVNTGGRRRDSKAGLLTTLACGPRGEPAYALEGSVFICGAAVQYLRDSLGVISSADETERLARSVSSTGGVYFVPAFVGLGAPWWDAEARGAIVGLTRGSGRAEIARAALEAMAYQVRDVIDASGVRVPELRVDGGASANDFLLQFQADLLGARVVRPRNTATTALGAAFLAGIGAGLWSSAAEIPIAVDRAFEPRMSRPRAEALHEGWRRAVSRVMIK
jgi:glycerol kinase